MHYPGRYTLPLNVVLLLERTKLSPHALRLFHGLFYYMDLVTAGEPTQISATFRRAKKLRCAQLRLEVATPGTNDNDWLKKVLSELLEHKLFDVLAISANGRYLEFCPGKLVKDASARVERFAPMRTAHIKPCRSVHDILFLARAALHGGGDWPTWHLPRIAEGPLGEPWSDCRDAWLDAAAKASVLLNHAYLVAPIAGPTSTCVDSVRVKAAHEATAWKPGTLYRFPVGSRPFPVVCGKRYRPLTRAEMAARRTWCAIRAEDGPRGARTVMEHDAPAALIREAAKDGVASAAGADLPLVEEGFPF